MTILTLLEAAATGAALILFGFAVFVSFVIAVFVNKWDHVWERNVTYLCRLGWFGALATLVGYFVGQRVGWWP